jgi:hypothetical protein
MRRTLYTSLYGVHEYHGNITGCSCYSFNINSPNKTGEKVMAYVFLLKTFFISSSSSKVFPLYCGFPLPKTKFRHLSLSLVSSSLSPWFAMLRLTLSIHLSLSLPLLRVPSGSL